MKKIINLVGQRFGRLTVLALSKDRTPSNRVKWDCRCDCGTIKSITGCDIKAGKIVSCGCYGLEQRLRTSSIALTTHGIRGAHPRFYSIWKGMVNRCINPKMQNYMYYGGRGIEVCDSWKDVTGFANDMLQEYLSAVNLGMDKPSIERVNNDGNYCKENCCWIPMKEQGKNKRKYLKRKTI